MKKTQTVYAFIDSQNLHLGVKSLGWDLDFKKFRVYLEEKYHVDRAFLFIGYDPHRQKMYIALQEMGYVCVFKPTLVMKDGSMKGNCDADLVLHAMIEYPNYDKAVIVTGDGDFYCLVEYFIAQSKMAALIIPNSRRCSALLKTVVFQPFHRFLNQFEKRLARPPKKEKTP